MAGAVRNRAALEEPRRSSSRGPAQQAPQAQRQINGIEKQKMKAQTFMDKWVEPSLAAPKPSYQDHGAGPYGVLEHMQPLGEVPNARVKARVKGDGSRKSVLGRSAAAFGPDAMETPEGTPAPGTATPQPLEPVSQLPIVIDDEKDGDYAPAVNGKKKERSTRSRAVKRKSESAPAAPPPSPPKLDVDSRPRATLLSPTYEGYTFEYDGEKLERVVDAAKARAREVGKPELADAVHEIYLQSLRELKLRVLLEAILTQEATTEQNTAFQEYVRAAKKKLKAAKLQARTQPTKANGTIEGTPIVHSPAPKLTLNPAPSHRLEPSSAIPSTEKVEPTKPRISLKVKSPHKDTHRLHNQGKMSVSPRKRSNSNASDSSLTDMTSNGGDSDMEAGDRPNNEAAAGPAGKLNGMRGKDHAAERGSLVVPGTGAKRSSAEAELEQERDREMAAKKQRMSDGVKRDYDSQESNIRPKLKAFVTRTQKPGPPPRTSATLEPNSRAASAKPSRAQSMDPDSPLSVLSSPATSRQSTPKVWQVKPQPKQRAKTKQSPEKKQHAALGGMSGAGGAGRESPIGDDDNEEIGSENQDYCSACNGSGFLLCCDGCDRSFHFECLDPPLNEDAKELDEPWFCYICVAKRPVALELPEKPTRGLFAPLFGSLKKRNPKNFELPENIRTFFEGVATDKNGAFTESLNPGKSTRSKPGYTEEQPNYYRERDSKGNLILCCSCGKGTVRSLEQPRRPMITCDHCSQHWHLDCLNPPLANPPALNQSGRKVHDWMCPLHIDQDLRKVDVSQLHRHFRTIHVRKPKVPKVQETALSRGFVNNGLIEIADDESEEDEDEFTEEVDEVEGTVTRLPAQGIKLDFIDKIKSTRVQQRRDDAAYCERARLAATAAAATVPRALEQANFAKRPFNEQQLALQLTQFAGNNQDLAFGEDRVENLVGTLIAEAPSEVVEEIMANENKPNSTSSAAPPSPPSSEQPGEQMTDEHRRELEMLRTLINRKLEGGKV